MSISIGQQIGRYQIVERLGEGGMACVYKAYDKRLERYVALKVISSNQQQSESFIKRFEREAKALAKFSHPNIVDIHDYGDFNGIPYLVMEYLPGGTLKNRMGAPVPYQEAARLILPIAQALDYAHQRNIIHRDIKPANILLSDTGIPMLSDFGIAKVTQAGQQTQLTAVGVGIGTPEYMSPEQGRGLNIDHRSDIYSLGVVFFELLTGRKPFRADTPMATILKHISDPIPRPSELAPGIPPEAEQIIFKAMAKRPQDRYQTMSELAKALENLIYGGETKIAPTDEQATVLRPKQGAQLPQERKAVIAAPAKPDSAAVPAAEIAPPLIKPPPRPPVQPSVIAGSRAPSVPQKRSLPIGVLVGGIIVFVILCGIVAIGFGARSFFFKSPAETEIAQEATDTIEVIPASTPTETPAISTPHPTPPQLSNKTAAEEAWRDGTTKTLLDLAPETYDSELENSVNRTLRYTVKLDQSQPLIWAKGWCATTDQILGDNLNKISFSFFLDLNKIEINRFNVYKGQSKDGSKCVWFYALLDQWSPGEHLIVSKLTILQPINDGELNYEVGEMIDEILVSVK